VLRHVSNVRMLARTAGLGNLPLETMYSAAMSISLMVAEARALSSTVAHLPRRRSREKFSCARTQLQQVAVSGHQWQILGVHDSVTTLRPVFCAPAPQFETALTQPWNS